MRATEGHVRHLPFDDELRPLQLRRRHLRRCDDLGRGANRSERIAQLMGQRRDEIVLASILLA